MTECFRVIASLEEHPSRLNKEGILEVEAREGNAELFRGIRAALDSMITFGVKQVPESTQDGAGLDVEKFWSVAQQLAERKLTGDAARDAIRDMMNSAGMREWNGWYRRILIKDLRCGVSEKTVNKVVAKINPQYSIPVFSCQLASDSAHHEDLLVGKKIVEVKLDGMRVITVVYPDGKIDQYSRNGKELVNFPHIKTQIVQHAFREPMVLDGEIMSASFQDLMKQARRKDNVQTQDAVLNLFDIVTLAEFQQGASDTSQTERSHRLKTWYEVNSDAMPNVTVVGQETVDLDTVQGRARFKMINTQAVAGGYEGIMVKEPGAVYESKRGRAWLKLKPFIEVSLTVTNIEEGTGKNEGRLGNLICEGTDDGRDIVVSVGSGFSDELRENIWANIPGTIGQVVEVRADAVTQNQNGTYSLRFPRFKTFRGFEPGEKL